MERAKKSFLGTGWAFPIAFDKKPECTVRRVSEIEDIEQSLVLLLGTRPGERVMRPDYGCNLEDLLFEPVNASLTTYIQDLISKAVMYYEPRVILREVRLLTDSVAEGLVLIELDIVVRSSNNRFNFVYDYYKREATIQQV
ncbi:MAG: GPW/gp25 family protein [Saprospiraceae bacterium]|nr:GPW/gp25 family protein [Saprospiraceae bacterium]